MARKIREYTGEDINVTFDAKRCIHAKECVNGLPAVFDTDKRPWVQPDNAGADDLAAVVMRCPTGALHFERTDGTPGEPTPDANTVTIAADGPLYVHGDVTLQTSEDATLEDTRIALCRCGDSANKPFCDNSHIEAGFKDAGMSQVSVLGADESTNGGLQINSAPNGPLLVNGNSEIITALGTVSFRGEKAALCRCGASNNKPFCDGTHKAVGFQA